VDSGLSISDLQKVNLSDRNLFERMMRRSPTPAPSSSKEVLTKSDGITIDDETIVRNMTQFRGKSKKDGTIDVYW
jgi:hypothetical protein